MFPFQKCAKLNCQAEHELHVGHKPPEALLRLPKLVWMIEEWRLLLTVTIASHICREGGLPPSSRVAA